MAEPRSSPPQTPLWTAQEIVSTIGGWLAGTSFNVTGVSIDTRTLQPGDLFVALKGARDGHAFAYDALKAGAAGILASQPVDGPNIEVPDTFIGLQRMGIVARERCGARRGAVTGSVGKTSVTQAVKAGLALAGPAHGSVKSYNNQIGVPLTLARMPRETARAVFEIGMNHAGEIGPLSKLVKPDAVAITTVGAVHTEAFPDGEAGVARAKAEIFAGLKPGGAAILNADDRWFDFLKGEAERAGAKVLSFGAAEGCDARLLGIEAGEGGAVVRASIHGREVEFPILQTGAHWGPNSLCTLLLLEALDVALDLGVAGARRVRAPGRARNRADGAGTGRRLRADRRELQRQSHVHARGPEEPRRAQGGRPQDRRAHRYAGAGRRRPASARRAGRTDR